MSKEQRQIEKEKKQLLRVMAKRPHQQKTEWTKALGWLNSKNNVDYDKVNKRLTQLKAEGVVIQIGHRYLIKIK